MGKFYLLASLSKRQPTLYTVVEILVELKLIVVN